jgi:hypothetical protein
MPDGRSPTSQESHSHARRAVLTTITDQGLDGSRCPPFANGRRRTPGSYRSSSTCSSSTPYFPDGGIQRHSSTRPQSSLAVPASTGPAQLMALTPATVTPAFTSAASFDGATSTASIW